MVNLAKKVFLLVFWLSFFIKGEENNTYPFSTINYSDLDASTQAMLEAIPHQGHAAFTDKRQIYRGWEATFSQAFKDNASIQIKNIPQEHFPYITAKKMPFLLFVMAGSIKKEKLKKMLYDQNGRK
jgi:hypothetical protein